MYITINDKNHVYKMLCNYPEHHIKVRHHMHVQNYMFTIIRNNSDLKTKCGKAKLTYAHSGDSIDYHILIYDLFCTGFMVKCIKTEI